MRETSQEVPGSQVASVSPCTRQLVRPERTMKHSDPGVLEMFPTLMFLVP